MCQSIYISSHTSVRNTAAFHRDDQVVPVPPVAMARSLSLNLYQQLNLPKCKTLSLKTSGLTFADFSEVSFLSSGEKPVSALRDFQSMRESTGGVLISHWLEQRISRASGSKMLTGNNTPLHEGRQKKGIFVILLHICKSRRIVWRDKCC